MTPHVRLGLGTLAVALASAFGSACVTTQVLVPPEQRTSIKQRLEGEERYLRLSYFVTPLFGDNTKRLLTAVPPEQVDLLEEPDGAPINPGPVQDIFAAGTVVRVKTVEFPSAVVQTERVLMTPRMLAWVYLDVAGTPKGSPPYVLVLRPQIKDEAEFMAEIDRALSKDDIRPQLSGYSDLVRDAIAKKEAVVDMTAEALEMAWGYPERRQIELDGEKKKETWVWPTGKRKAVLVDGRVTELN